MIYLTSNGLTSPKLVQHFKSHCAQMQSVVVVTTASTYKHEDRHIPEIRAFFEALAMKVELMDIEVEDISRLSDFDIIYFIGGNPFYLLHYLRIHRLKAVLSKHVKRGRAIIGNSAGSMVLTPSIGIASLFTPEMNLHELEDFTGMQLTNIEIVPHIGRFEEGFKQFKTRVEDYTHRASFPVIQLSDGEAIFIRDREMLHLGGKNDKDR